MSKPIKNFIGRTRTRIKKNGDVITQQYGYNPATGRWGFFNQSTIENIPSFRTRDIVLSEKQQFRRNIMIDNIKQVFQLTSDDENTERLKNDVLNILRNADEEYLEWFKETQGSSVVDAFFRYENGEGTATYDARLYVLAQNLGLDPYNYLGRPATVIEINRMNNIRDDAEIQRLKSMFS